MASNSFYPDGNGNRVDWNTNVITNQNLLPGLGFTAAQVTSIVNDCAMAVYLLTTVGEMADSLYGALHGFVASMQKAPLGTAGIPYPTLPAWATTTPAPPVLVPPGIDARRSAWVAVAKKSTNYNPDTVGRTLRLEAVITPFNPATYVAELLDVRPTGHETVAVKVGKGGGQVTMLVLQMQRGSDPTFRTVGQFTGRSYIDHTALVAANVPEVRGYQLLAMQNDAVIGQPSPIITVTVS